MNRFVLQGIALLFVHLSAFAQSPKFPKLSKQELEMSVYPQDSSAEAVVLHDLGDIQVRENGQAGHFKAFIKRHTRIKILKNSATSRGTVSFSYYRGGGQTREYVQHINGKTQWLENGEIKSEELNKSAVFDTKESKNYNTIKFTLPRVKEGCVIDYEYEIVSDLIFDIRDWHFQWDIPVAKSECYSSFHRILKYRVSFQQPMPLSSYKNRKGMEKEDIFHYLAEDVPALRTEAYTAAIQDYRSRLRFELYQAKGDGFDNTHNFTTTWADVDKALLADVDFGGYIKANNYLREVAKELNAAHKDTLARVTAAHEHIRTRMNWNDLNSHWTASSGRSAYERKTGNSAEINLMLVGLLQEMGLKAYPVAISTRSHGTIFQEYPSLKYFDDVVGLTRINGKNVLLDATNSCLQPNQLSERYLNYTGRLIDEERPEWIPITPQRAREAEQIELVLTPDGLLEGKYSQLLEGYQAASLRQKILKSERAKFVKGLAKTEDGLELSDPTIENLETLSSPLIIRMKASYETQKVGDKIYFTPMLGKGITENPFKHETRLYPVDFGSPTDFVTSAYFDFPETYTVESMPQSKILALPDNGGKFIFQSVVIGNRITLSSSLRLLKPYYLPEEYPNLKKIYDYVVALHAEQVVLKKK